MHGGLVIEDEETDALKAKEEAKEEAKAFQHLPDDDERTDETAPGS